MIQFSEAGKRPYEEKLGNLKYGSIIRGVEGHRDCVYIKINKHQCGQGIDLDWPSNCSVLCNLRTGALRAVSGNSCVVVLECDAEIIPTEDLDQHTKGGC